jgi:phage-related protein
LVSIASLYFSPQGAGNYTHTRLNLEKSSYSGIIDLAIGLIIMREIIYYRSESGNNPIQDFLDSLSAKQRTKVLWVLGLVQDQDRVSTKFFKKLVSTNDIWEIRVCLGNDIFRLLGFLDNNNLVILTNGFVKKTQATPRQEIAIAEKRKNDYVTKKKKEK